jgi:hypothetical protein
MKYSAAAWIILGYARPVERRKALGMNLKNVNMTQAGGKEYVN